MRRKTISGGTLTPAVLVLLLFIVGCTGGGGPGGAGEKPASIVGPEWRVEEIAGAPVSGESPITLKLDAGGGASGRGGCNSYGGSYALAGDALHFGPMAATRMACAPALMDQEQRYFDTLAKVERYAVADDGALLLETGDGKEIRLRRE
jgi:heat shock protein HslJ